MAYVIFTSGSTGKPKGVLVAHAGLINLVNTFQNRYQLTPADRVLQFFSLSFDGSVFEIAPTLASGAALYLLDREATMPGDAIAATLKAHAITVMTMVPSVAASMPDVALPALTRMTVAGEALPVDVMQRWAKGRQLFNGYGPTETTVWGSVYQCAVTDVAAPIGTPIENARLTVLDPHGHGQLVPIGVSGELHIGGAGLARGYLNQPARTAAAFIPDPFSTEAGARMYRTGDLVKWDAGGRLHFIGRIDHQVKLRGFRIELGEIEVALARHPLVAAAVVNVHTNAANVQRLVGYVVGKRGLDSADLRRFVGSQLPDYMVPAIIMPLAALPLTVNNKIDRAALPAPVIAARLDYAAPRNETEQALVTIWQTLLGMPQVSIHDNFFEIGGDSILTIRVVSKAREAGIMLSARDLFANQTIAELAIAAATSVTAAAEQGIVTGRAQLTPIQRWFFEQAYTQPNHWNMTALLSVAKPLERALLASAMVALCNHHDLLRAVSVPDGGLELRAALQSYEVCWFDESADLTRTMTNQQAALDIEQGPLLRVCYFERQFEPDQLAIIAHHLIIDAVSWRILLEDLQTAYRQLAQGKPPQLPAKTTDWPTWTSKQNAYAATLTSAHDWTTHTPTAVPPLDFVDGDNRMKSAEQWRFTLSAATTQALLKDVHAAYNTQINDILLTAIAFAYREWTEQPTLAIAMEGHGRDPEWDTTVDLSRTVGWFTTLFPLDIVLPDGDDLGAAIKSVKEQLRQRVPRGTEYGLLRYARSDDMAQQLAAQPQPAISFNYLGQFNEQTQADSLFTWSQQSPGPVFAPANHRPYVLDVSGAIHDGTFRLTLHFSRDLHRKATIAAFGRCLMGHLRALIAHCQSAENTAYTPSDFSKANLDQSELDDLLGEITR